MVNPRQRLVHHVQELERLEALRQQATADLKAGFETAKAEGYDATTLKVVLKLRKMTPEQRRERKALEAIYMAALGMLEGDPLTDEARRRLDGSNEQKPSAPPDAERAEKPAKQEPPAPPPEQPPLILKDPEEARQEGAAAPLAGKRIYDNPYPAGDPCRAAWDEGWCAQQKSHGMEPPAAYQRRSAKPPDDKDKNEKDHGAGDADRKDAA